ncbi:MAG: hypothetical protein O7C59_05515 [Rickettsia endosymbiont of Ixodes persulcatus]|nr:hypothetical protein [Rickettsia endosymbiont of Ixodes persulcatus]
MDEKSRDIDKAEKLRLNAVQIQPTLSSNETQGCLDTIENLQREISHLKQEIQRTALEQQRYSARSTAFRR